MAALGSEDWCGFSGQETIKTSPTFESAKDREAAQYTRLSLLAHAPSCIDHHTTACDRGWLCRLFSDHHNPASLPE